MNKVFHLVLAAFLVLGCVFLAACEESGEEEKITAVGITVSGAVLEEKALLVGTEIEDLTVAVVFSDGTSSAPVPAEASMISGYDKVKTGYQTVKVSYEGFAYEFEVLVADVIVKNAKELEEARANQADNQTWAVLGGTYDIAPDEERTVEGATGWYFAITANNLRIYGIDRLTLTSSIGSENGIWAKQNFITVFGNDVVLDGLNLVSKTDVNKVIEVVGGDNFVLSNSMIAPPEGDPKFAGSIFLNAFEGKTATFENVEMQYGRMTFSGCNETSLIKFKSVTIDFAGAEKKGFAEDGYTTENYYWGIFNTVGAKIEASDTEITVSESAFKHEEYADLFLNFLPESGVKIRIVG